MVVLIAAVILAAVPVSGAAQGGYGLLVCIDPGHGGKDSGAVANGLQEKDLNLDIARKIKPLVEAAGYRVIMTRESDVYVSLEDRCAIANRAHAAIFVSIHNNAYQQEDQGTETYCYYDSEEGRRLATEIHREVVKRIDRPDRGVKEAGFYVLKNSDMTSSLLEGAFLTNPEDARLLEDEGFRQKIAEGVAAGVNYYLVDPGRFNTYIQVMNPDPDKTAQIELGFMRGNGEEAYTEEIPPGTRKTFRVDDYIFNDNVSTLVRSLNGVPVVAERAMDFDFEKGTGWHGAPGVTAPACKWYLAEGSTAWGYSTFILVQNPNPDANPVHMYFMCADGSVGQYECTLPPYSRFTLDVSKVPGMGSADFSTVVFSTGSTLVERAMYWNQAVRSGGHDSAAVPNPEKTWYLAEGYTGKGFDTYLLIGNPNAVIAPVSVTYMVPDGGFITEYYELPANSRKTVHLNEVKGLSDKDVSVQVIAAQPVVVERSEYFDYKGVKEGSNSTGVPAPSSRWYLAGGCTGAGFETYVLLANPNSTDTRVDLEFAGPDGRKVNKGVIVAARSRQTIFLNEVPGLENTEVWTEVTSEQPIVVERSVYKVQGARPGGYGAMGVTAPATEWYFAEGCTR